MGTGLACHLCEICPFLASICPLSSVPSHLSPLLAAPFCFQFPSLPESTSLSDPRASGSKLLAKTMKIFLST